MSPMLLQKRSEDLCLITLVPFTVQMTAAPPLEAMNTRVYVLYDESLFAFTL